MAFNHTQRHEGLRRFKDVNATNMANVEQSGGLEQFSLLLSGVATLAEADRNDSKSGYCGLESVLSCVED